MGGTVSRLVKRFLSKARVRILLVGLDASGMTTILYKLKLGEIVTTVPTIGFNVETVEYKNVSFTVWDVGGQQKVYPEFFCYIRARVVRRSRLAIKQSFRQGSIAWESFLVSVDKQA